MKIYFLLILSLFTLTSKTGFSQTSKVPEIVIENTSKEKLYFTYFDSLKTLVSTQIPKGSSIKIESHAPILLIADTRKKTPFFIFPNDTIKAKTDGQTDYILEVNDPIRRNELNFLREVNKKLYNNKFSNTMLSHLILVGEQRKNPLKYIDSVEINYQKEMELLSLYKSQNEISETFERLCADYFYYKLLNSKIQLIPFKEEFLSLIPEGELVEIFNLYQQLNDDNLIYLDIYKQAATNYLFYLQLKYKEDAYEKVLEKFNGTTKDFLLMSLLRGYANNNQKMLMKSYSTFMNDCKTQAFRDEILKRYEHESLIQQSDVDKFLTLDNSVYSFEELLKKHEGNTIYVDFWASWCAPCLEEMPSSFKAASTYKDIVFLYISVDKDINAWSKEAKRLGLDERNSYLLSTGFKSNLAKQLKIQTIPHYVIINSKGEIQNRNAPRPSDDELELELKKYN